MTETETHVKTQIALIKTRIVLKDKVSELKKQLDDLREHVEIKLCEMH